MIPIPEYAQDALKNPSANFSLLFPRLVDWNDAGEFKKRDDAASDLLKKYKATKAIYDSGVLKKIHERQHECVAAFGGKEISATLVSPFITGLGAGHPTETGMILDRNTGVPYIPASSVKGVLRTAYAVNKAKESGATSVSEKDIEDIFGAQDKKGRVVVFDAYPKKVPDIQADIMNPHFSKYYGKEKGHELPLENEDPKPIKFLSVRAPCEFVFRYVADDEDTASKIEEAFKTAFSVVGFGGKTSIGYGRFKVEEKSSRPSAASETKPIDVECLVAKLPLVKVKPKRPEPCQAVISKIEGDNIFVKLNILLQNGQKIMGHEIRVNKMAEAAMGQEVEILFNSFDKKGVPQNAKIQKILK